MHANGLHGRLSISTYPAPLPIRVPGHSGVPDGPAAVPPPLDLLESIACAVRRWTTEAGVPDVHR